MIDRHITATDPELTEKIILGATASPYVAYMGVRIDVDLDNAPSGAMATIGFDGPSWENAGGGEAQALKQTIEIAALLIEADMEYLLFSSVDGGDVLELPRPDGIPIRSLPLRFDTRWDFIESTVSSSDYNISSPVEYSINDKWKNAEYEFWTARPQFPLRYSLRSYKEKTQGFWYIGNTLRREIKPSFGEISCGFFKRNRA